MRFCWLTLLLFVFLLFFVFVSKKILELSLKYLMSCLKDYFFENCLLNFPFYDTTNSTFERTYFGPKVRNEGLSAYCREQEQEKETETENQEGRVGTGKGRQEEGG